MSAQKETTLSKDTKINLGLVILLIGSIIGGAFWIKDSIAENTVKLLLVEHRLTSLEKSIEEAASDRWRRVDMINLSQQTSREAELWSMSLIDKLSLEGQIDPLVLPEVD